MPDRIVTVQKRIEDRKGYCIGSFDAMASPCEILLDSSDLNLTRRLTQIAATEAWRIEDKFSRYNPASLCAKINSSHGSPVAIDGEVYQLLEFANQCYLISDGLFDITSGVLRRIWTFDGSDRLPTNEAVKALLPLIGWQKLSYDTNSITLPNGMQIDFGGIGKEYAVDRVSQLLKKAAPDISIVVNFGGDIGLTCAKANQQAWTIGIENPALSETIAGNDINSIKTAIAIKQGALATSGDARRYLFKDGKRYSHILNPKTGWPIIDAPRSVTVAAPKCIQAGMLATIALLQGHHAKPFLDAQGVKYWLT